MKYMIEFELPDDAPIRTVYWRWGNLGYSGHATAKPVQQWIPCSTALPEHDGEYLVTIKAFTIDQTVYADIDIARYTGGKWRKGFPVTAWQPLPTPYREGGRNA